MNSDAFHPVFFDTGRVVHLLDQHTEQTFCGLAGGRAVRMVTVDLAVPHACRRCVANAAKDREPAGVNGGRA